MRRLHSEGVGLEFAAVGGRDSGSLDSVFPLTGQPKRPNGSKGLPFAIFKRNFADLDPRGVLLPLRLALVLLRLPRPSAWL